MPRLTVFTEEEIYREIITSLPQFYATELKSLADHQVMSAPDKVDSTTDLGWTFLLSEDPAQPIISGIQRGEKFPELEKTLTSIVMLHVFLNGSDDAYAYFVQQQTDLEQRLSKESFKRLAAFYQGKIGNTETSAYRILEAMLIYTDVAKTARTSLFPVTTKSTHEFNRLLFAEDREVIRKVLPSIVRLTDEQLQRVRRLISCMHIHLGKIRHMEHGIGPRVEDNELPEQKSVPEVGDNEFLEQESAPDYGLFTHFVNGILQKQVSFEEVHLLMMMQYCDVAAVYAHGNKNGSNSLREGDYQRYNEVHCLLQSVVNQLLKDDKSPQEVLLAALREDVNRAGQRLSINVQMPQEKVALRLALMLRITDPIKIHFLKEIINSLPIGQQKELKIAFGDYGHLNSLRMAPDYLPAIGANLQQHDDFAAELRIVMQRVIAGYICTARIITHYFKTNKDDLEPLNFREYAELAKNPSNLSHFQPESFKVEEFDLSEHKVQLRQPLPELRRTFG